MNINGFGFSIRTFPIFLKFHDPIPKKYDRIYPVVVLLVIL